MFDAVLSVLFPERCRSCRKSGTPLCEDCIATLPPSFSIESDIPALALFNYSNGIVQQAVWELKYHRRSPLAKRLVGYGGSQITDYLASLIQSTEKMSIILVPVPQQRSKKYQRGFNQSEVIATWLLYHIPGATVKTILLKTRATTAQARTHSRNEREKNLKYSMSAHGKPDKKALYIIVDDVITTGSTITEASRALRAAGFRNIIAIALAHGYANRL